MAARLTVLDVSAMIRIGASAGLTLRYVGLAGMFGGSWPAAAAMAACTSRAAPLMSRARSNCRVMVVAPRNDVDVISVTPAMRPNWPPSGVATARSEEHTSELQSPCNLVCRLLLAKNNRLLLHVALIRSGSPCGARPRALGVSRASSRARHPHPVGPHHDYRDAVLVQMLLRRLTVA